MKGYHSTAINAFLSEKNNSQCGIKKIGSIIENIKKSLADTALLSEGEVATNGQYRVVNSLVKQAEDFLRVTMGFKKLSEFGCSAAVRSYEPDRDIMEAIFIHKKN